MALTDAQWAAEVTDIVADLVAGTITQAQASARLKTATEDWPTRTLSNADLAARVSRFLARLNGLLVMEGPPDDAVGELNTFYFDTASGEFYGPKGAGGWGESSFSLVGPPGPAIELQTTPTHVQWRVVGDPDWVNLIALADLKGEDGKEIELRSTATHIQWRVVGASTWIDLLARADLKGDTGATPVITITTSTGAAGSEATVTKTGTAEAPAFAISIPRGNTGGTGATPVLSVGTVTTAPTGDPAGATFTGTAEEPVLNLTLPRGGTGNTGPAAWTPVFATVVDGERRVQRIVDWVGGGGTKPATGKYVGSTGLVDTAAEATDVRGAGGSGSGDMIGANNLSDLTDKAAARTTLSVYSKGEVDTAIDGRASDAELATLALTVGGKADAASTYTKTQVDTALSGKQASLGFTPEDASKKGAGSGYAGLDAGGKVPSGQLPDPPTVPVKATGAELRTGTDDAKFLTAKSVTDAAAFVTTTWAASLSLDLSIPAQLVVLGGNTTLTAPTNAESGVTARAMFKQPATGGPFTVSYNAAYVPYGSTPAVSTAANAVDLMVMDPETSATVRFTLQKGGAA